MIELISQYLKTHRRLNIPGVGAFMVKDSHGDIIFSELLKRDDGVLRSLLEGRGMRDIEAAATVDRFVFELKHDTEVVGGEFVMDGLGVLRREDNGRLVFVAQIAEAQQEAAAQGEVQTDELQPQEPKPQENISKEQPIKPVSSSSRETSPSRYTPERIKELYSSPKRFREKDPALGDLTYSKSQKPLGGYTYIQNGAKRKGVDKVLLFGIIAAIIAIAVIAYGYYVGHIVDGGSSVKSAPRVEVPVETSEEVPQADTLRVE